MNTIYSKIRVNASVYEDNVLIPSSISLFLNSFSSISINSNIDNMTDIAEVKIPIKYITFKNNNKSIQYTNPNYSNTGIEINVGATIIISLSFNPIYVDKGQHPIFGSSIKNWINDDIQFYGYVSGFREENDLVTIVCEDSMWLFKQNNVKVNFDVYKDETTQTPNKLVDLVDKLFEESKQTILNKGTTEQFYDQIKTYKKITDVNLNRYKSEFKSPAAILQEIKDLYGLYIYFRNDTEVRTVTTVTGDKYTYNLLIPALHTGLKYLIDVSSSVENYRKKFKFIYPYSAKSQLGHSNYTNEDYKTYNPIIDVSNLTYEYNNKEDDLVINYISQQDNNTTYYSSYGYVNGVAKKATKEDDIKNWFNEKKIQITKKIPNLSQDNIDNFAKYNFENFPNIGFKGSFTCFGKPLVRIGDVVQIKVNKDFNSLTSDKGIEETYFVDGVVTTCDNTSGFIQTITLGAKIS